MGVFTYETENTSVIPPARLFKAVVLDSEKLIPNIAPLAISSTDIIEGNGQPQSTITFGKGSIFKDVEHRIIIDDVRRQTLTHVYKVIDWFDILGKISYETKILASPDGGSILKSSSNYDTNHDHEIMEEQVEAGKEKASKLFKAVERFILAHPDFYN